MDWTKYDNDNGIPTSDPWSNAASGAVRDRPSDSPSSTMMDTQPPALTFDSPITRDTYFSEAYFGANDYFPSDLDGMESYQNTLLGDSTSESSPEPASAVDLDGISTFQSEPTRRKQRSTDLKNVTSTNQSPVISVRRAATPSSAAASSPASDASLSSIINNINFATSITNSVNLMSGPLDSVREESTETDPASIVKRQRGGGNPDVISACWLSPLCPNHTKEGIPPNPSTCGGECAPFLFDDRIAIPPEVFDQQLLSKDLTATEIADLVTEPRPNLKRSESDSSIATSGRVSTKSGKEPQLKNGSSTSSPQARPGGAEEGETKNRRRLPHNQVERKYRESLNTQLESLKRVVPALQQNSRGTGGADIEDLPVPSKPSKAVILASATAYIKQMEKEKKQIAEENALLRNRVRALQALVKCDDCSLMQYVINMKINNPA